MILECFEYYIFYLFQIISYVFITYCKHNYVKTLKRFTTLIIQFLTFKNEKPCIDYTSIDTF